MKRILFLLLIAFALSPALETSRAQTTGQGQSSRSNLSGIWEDGDDQVTITDTRGSVTARYSRQKQCSHEGTVTPYTSGFIVTGSGSTLTGTGTICYYGPKKEPVEPPATPNNSPRGVKQDSKVTLTVGADGDTLAGTQVGYHGSVSFTLKRKCQTDTAPGITQSAGSTFINPSSGRAVRHSGPSKSCPEIGQLTPGVRLVYRFAVFNEETGEPEWYLVEPPSGEPGWVPAGDTSNTRPPAPPPQPPKNLPDSGLTGKDISASPTAGGRARPNTSSGNRRGTRPTRPKRKSNRP